MKYSSTKLLTFIISVQLALQSSKLQAFQIILVAHCNIHTGCKHQIILICTLTLLFLFSQFCNSFLTRHFYNILMGYKMRILSSISFKQSHSASVLKKLTVALLYQNLPILKIHIFYFSLMHLECYRDHLASLSKQRKTYNK